MAQSLDDLNIQIHGFATQGFLYTTNNNFFSTNSSDDSSAWTEDVFTITAQPMNKLRIGMQEHHFLLGTFGNTIYMDWVEADYKQNEYLGFRFGKVKTPTGLLNELQDIDSAFTWSPLPQETYGQEREEGRDEK